MAERPGLMFYYDVMPALSMLSDAEAGQLFKAAMEYGQFGVVPNLDGMVAMAWTFVKPKIDRDGEAYQQTCIQNAYNRYLGECKKHGTTALSREAWEVKIYAPRQQWLTSVDDGSDSSPTGTTASTGTITPTADGTKTTTTDSKSKRKGTGAGKGARGETDPDTTDSRRNAALDLLESYAKKKGL